MRRPRKTKPVTPVKPAVEETLFELECDVVVPLKGRRWQTLLAALWKPEIRLKDVNIIVNLEEA